MTRRRELDHHRHSLDEIREIMNSMKTLAYRETRKLGRFLAAQQAVVEKIEDIAADFLAYYPDMLPAAAETTTVFLMIGSERGFCGDFNHAILRHLEDALESNRPQTPVLLPVGRKLHVLLEHDARVSTFISGVSVAEEVYAALDQIVEELTRLRLKYGPVSLYGLHHRDDGKIVTQVLLPPLQHLLGQPPRFPFAPGLNLPPRDFLMKLADHYLFAALYEILYTSLMSENRLRVSHLEGAIQHLDEESATLVRRSNTLRQEEITEEIEVILLGATSLYADKH
jgi:F-type H+-transporting ATPase subunit gamma